MLPRHSSATLEMAVDCVAFMFHRSPSVSSAELDQHFTYISIAFDP